VHRRDQEYELSLQVLNHAHCRSASQISSHIYNQLINLIIKMINKSIINNRLHTQCHILINSIKHCSCLDIQMAPPPGKHLLNLTPCSILAHWLHVWKCHPQNQSTQLIATPSQEDLQCFAAVGWVTGRASGL